MFSSWTTIPRRGKMMKPTKLFLVPLISILILLAACSSGPATTTSQGGAFLGGTQGVTATFEPFGVEEEGVFSIFDSESFPIEVTLHNQGEYEIQPADVKVKLLGPSTEEFQGLGNRELPNDGTIEKISELVPEGGEETVNFGSDVKYK